MAIRFKFPYFFIWFLLAIGFKKHLKVGEGSLKNDNKQDEGFIV